MNPTDELGNLCLFPLHTAGGQSITSDEKWRDVTDLHSHNPATKIVAVDFETYYSSKYSLSRLSTWDYVHHTAFDAYLVALERFDGDRWLRWVGHPKDAPWADLEQDEWLSHNAFFDSLCLKRLIELGIVTLGFRPKAWHCTADLSIFLQAGRNLQLAVKNFFGVEVSKDVRAGMKTGSASVEEMRDYAADDSFWCAKIWTHHGHKWSTQERELSTMTRRQSHRGVGINREACERGVEHLKQVKAELREILPWGHKGPPTSAKLFAAACMSEGIAPPYSLAQDSVSAQAWEEEHGERFPWIQQIRRYTKANQMQGSLQLLLDRNRPDDTVPFSLVYCKATHTKRWQHAEGLRIQNLDKDPVEGIHLRNMLVPRPGKVFVIADLSQIEPRVLNWRAGDLAFLDLCRQGQSPYDAHARATMGYTNPGPLKHVDPLMYSLAKARLLALGYQAGPDQFKEMAWTFCGLRIELDEQTVLVGDSSYPMSEFSRLLSDQAIPDWEKLAQQYGRGELSILPSATNAVYDFRNSSTTTTKLWSRRMNEVCAKEGKHYRLDIGNGSVLRYFDVSVTRKQAKSRQCRTYTKREAKGWVIRNSKNPKDQKYLYGGKIVENEVQWIAREVFAYYYHLICQIPGVEGIFSVHDEGIWEVDEERGEELLAMILEIFRTPPPWAPDLPVAADGELSYCYKK